ncbi:MAG: hypothetical protein ACLU9S_09630 [Oscillospiraceae bacterium]
MRISLLPKAIFPALTQISPEYLHRQGIRLLMLDFDNTIVPYTTDTPSPEMEQWRHRPGPVRDSDLRGVQ